MMYDDIYIVHMNVCDVPFIFEHAIVRVFVHALVRATARASVRDSSIPFVVDVMYDENYFEKFLNSPHF